jgi:hypothetical protein
MEFPHKVNSLESINIQIIEFVENKKKHINQIDIK